MASPHELFAQLRIETFDAEGLSEFGRRLGYEKSHIYRLETGQTRIRPKHVGFCRDMRVPPARRAAFEAIIKELGEAVAAQELPRIQAKKDKARSTRRARDQARKATRVPAVEHASEPAPAWLQSWEAALTYLAEEEARASWSAAVEFLQAEADWTSAQEFIIAAESARLYLVEEAWRADWAAAVEWLQAEAQWTGTLAVVIAAELAQGYLAELWQTDWAAAVEYLQGQADWANAVRVLLAAALIESLVAPVAADRPSPPPSAASRATPSKHRRAPSHRSRRGSPFERRELRQSQQRRARTRAPQANRSRSAPLLCRLHRRAMRRPSFPSSPVALWTIAMGSMAVALCTLLVLLFGRLPQHVYVSPQEPAEGEQVPGRDIGQRQARVHRLIPPKPFKRQKIAPCDKQNGEETINGGCWYGGRDPGPDGCGSKEYEDQRGKCWRWVEDSTQPSADVPTDGGTGYGGAGEKLTPRFP